MLPICRQSDENCSDDAFSQIIVLVFNGSDDIVFFTIIGTIIRPNAITSNLSLDHAKRMIDMPVWQLLAN